MKKNDVIVLEFKEGKFEGVAFELNTDEFELVENKDGGVSLNYSVNYDAKNEKIIEHGATEFLEEIGKMLIEGIEQEIIKLEEKGFDTDDN